MPQHIHLDFETFSEADIKSVGSYRYAFDPTTTILCAAMALGDEYPAIWHQGVREELLPAFEPYWDALEDPEVLIFAHNAMFEMAICQALLQKTWGIACPDLSRFRCTMSLARRAALPGKLEMLAIALGLTNLKDKKGKSLINKFSVMQKGARVSKKNPEGGLPHRIRPEDEPEAFSQFMAYCQQDVVVEQEVAFKLSYFDEPINNSNYSLDARINARGVPVNLDALRHAQKLIDEETELVSERFRRLVGVEVTQNAKLLEWINANGCNFDNLQAETVDSFLEGYDGLDDGDAPDVVVALRMKQSIAYASIKKIATMLACAGPRDNRIRGMMNHHGAGTGRWTASLVQFQNMKKATIKHSEDAYREICEGVSREMLELCYGPVLEVISSCIRHFVHDIEPCARCDGQGEIDETAGEQPYDHWSTCQTCNGSKTQEREFNDADYSAIEARIVCWLAGQEDALCEYRAGIDRYKVMASFIYGIPVEEINKHPQRFVGKFTILGCGFQMGAPKFRATVKRQGGYDLPLGMEEIAVKAFRAKHKALVKYWYAVEEAAKQAILNKGQVFRPIPKRRRGEDALTPLPKFADVRFKCEDIGGLPFLIIRLPSGRKLAYPKPRVEKSKKFEGATSIVFYGNIKGVIWGDVDTFAGSLVENITQAVAADIMAHGAHNAENASYEIATLIHDQALAYHYPERNQTPEEFVKLLTELPSWADGLPIEAEGGLVPFYKKD